MKKAIIIGASSGIGKGISLELLSKNYKIAISGASPTHLAATKSTAIQIVSAHRIVLIACMIINNPYLIVTQCTVGRPNFVMCIISSG